MTIDARTAKSIATAKASRDAKAKTDQDLQALATLTATVAALTARVVALEKKT